MSVPNELNQKASYYIGWLEKNKDKVPNADRLIKILKQDKKAGHIEHAEFIKRFVEGEKFKVTDIEVKGKCIDVDIELNRSINIQVWHGASVSTHNIRKGKISKEGGVETDWEKDKMKIQKKLNQLPDSGFGLLICKNYSLGIVVLPEWIEQLPDNKAMAELYCVDYGHGPQNESTLYHSDSFKHSELAKEVLFALGFPVKSIGYFPVKA